jgi:hypothetical protein
LAAKFPFFGMESVLFSEKITIVVLLEKSIPVQRRTNGKFMLVWKNNMLFSGKMTVVILPEESVFFS